MLQGTTLHGWKIGEPVTKWWRGKYIHLYRVTKACAQCQQEMTLDVTKAALMGTAKNSGFHLTRCLECRATTRSQPSTSRPVVLDATPQSTAPQSPGDASEVEHLRAVNSTMLQEINCSNEYVRELEAKIKALEAKKPEPPFDPHKMLANELAKLKGPWSFE
jgi:hypothetical protein